MKKGIAGGLALLMLLIPVFALAQDGVVNPMVEKQDVGTIEVELGLKMPLPDGAKAIACHVIGDVLGDVQFELGGQTYTLRAQLSQEAIDISGVYDQLDTTEEFEIDRHTVKLAFTDGMQGVATWYVEDTAYALIILQGATEDAMIDVLIQIV